MSTVITTTMTNPHYEMKLENGLNGHAPIPNGYRKNGHVKQEYRETPVSFIYSILKVIPTKLIMNQSRSFHRLFNL